MYSNIIMMLRAICIKHNKTYCYPCMSNGTYCEHGVTAKQCKDCHDKDIDFGAFKYEILKQNS